MLQKIENTYKYIYLSLYQKLTDIWINNSIK